MIITLVSSVKTSLPIIKGGVILSEGFSKRHGIVTLANSFDTSISSENLNLENYLSENQINVDLISLNKKLSEIHEICETMEASFLIIQLSSAKNRVLKSYLQACRELRIPYLFVKDSFDNIAFDKVIVPVNFLIEEIEKAQFAAAFGRFLNSEITLLQAKDYGTRAAGNVAKIKSVIEKFDIKYKLLQGTMDSFKIEFDALRYATEHEANLVISSSSREYGLDDIVFGPKEVHLLNKSSVPIMFINPRGDLYVLCE
ncbi:hypothetical protein MASR2M117_08070 [Paludibacter sp.]